MRRPGPAALADDQVQSAADPWAGIELLIALAASIGAYFVVYQLAALHGLGPLRNLAATLAATLPFAAASRGAAIVARANYRHLLLVGAGVLALRLVIPLPLANGSDDAYRYLWDGLVQANGNNPYVHPPAARTLAHLRDATLYPRIFRPDMRTVYPPLAQMWFLLAYLLTGTSFVGLKLIYLLHDGATTVLLYRLLKQHNRPPLLALLYAWSPLVVVQTFAGAHLDALVVPWLVLALLVAETHPLIAGFSLGLSAMARPIAVLCWPALALRRPPRQALAAGVGFACACALLIAPYASAGGRMVESLAIYGQHWQFNGSLFPVLEALFAPDPRLRPSLYVFIALAACASGLLPGSRSMRASVAIGTYLAFAPTVYPWYAIPLLATSAVFSDLLPLALPPLVTMSDLVFVDGTVGGSWRVPTFVLCLEYVAIYALVAHEALRCAHRRAQVDSGVR